MKYIENHRIIERFQAIKVKDLKTIQLIKMINSESENDEKAQTIQRLRLDNADPEQLTYCQVPKKYYDEADVIM